MTWKPIAEFPGLFDKAPDIEVRSSEGRSCMAWRDPDTGRWMDVSDPEHVNELAWTPVEWRDLERRK